MWVKGPTNKTGQVRLAAAGCAGDEDVFATVDPGDVGEDGELVFGQVTGRRAVDVLEGDGVAKFAQAEVHFHAPTLAVLALRFWGEGDPK